MTIRFHYTCGLEQAGEGNLAQLREVKQCYDPDRFFHFPQSL